MSPRILETSCFGYPLIIIIIIIIITIIIIVRIFWKDYNMHLFTNTTSSQTSLTTPTWSSGCVCQRVWPCSCRWCWWWWRTRRRPVKGCLKWWWWGDRPCLWLCMRERERERERPACSIAYTYAYLCTHKEKKKINIAHEAPANTHLSKVCH